MAPKPKTKGTAKGLKKKLGPFPVYVYLIGIAAVGAYLYYRHRQTGITALPGSSNQQVIPIAIPSGGQGGAPSTGNGTVSSPAVDTTGSSVNFPYDYATNTDLQQGLNNLGTTLSGQIASSVAAITFPTPTINPNINITIPPAKVTAHTAKSTTAAKKHATKTAKPTRYYTRKTQVPLKHGQKLHFTKGKGYYAG